MVNARRKGSVIGRPPVLVKQPRLRRQWAELEAQVRAGELSQRQSATTLGVERATVQRLLAV
jgi:DNA invertase Pin-like site-specific DNA recombinase